MKTDRDPTLLALFAQADSELDNAEFTDSVMQEIDSQRHKTMLLWSVFAIAALACFALVASPVITAVSMATDLLPASLVSIETDWLQQLVAPINSVAAALVIGILLVRKFFRRILG